MSDIVIISPNDLAIVDERHAGPVTGLSERPNNSGFSGRNMANKDLIL